MDREIDELNEIFGLDDRLNFARGDGGFVFARVDTGLCRARISRHGAQVLSFAPGGERELLWLSPKARYERGKAIRGGVPLCFPWFGPHPRDPSLPQHGYARLMDWAFLGAEEGDEGELILRLGLPPASCPGAVQGLSAEVSICLSSELEIALTGRNEGDEKLSYTAALHSYLSVSEVEGLAVEGLGEEIEIRGEVDREFCASHGPYRLEDPAFARRIVIEKENSSTTVVWNPGPEKARALLDIGEEPRHGMVCVEAVRAGANRVTLEPGEEETFATTIGLTGR
jgi:glucose-6-phosphate 1-epimerase